MITFSAAFGLTKSQPELDFVDVDLDADYALHVDPFALSQRRDEWSECVFRRDPGARSNRTRGPIPT
jgi:hypothetical protein